MQVGFWIELPVQRRLCPVFVKLWIPVNGTYEGVSGYTISTGFSGLIGDQQTLGFWGVTAYPRIDACNLVFISSGLAIN